MSFLDRIAAAVTPAASDEDRAEARRRIEELSMGEPFVEDIVRQHKQIEALFAEARSAAGAGGQTAVRELALLLTGHAMAEEAVVYPEVSEHSGKTHAGMAYEEHAMTKVQLAKLQQMDPGSQEWIEKLDHIEGAVKQHIYQEEDSWLPDVIRNAPAADRQRMSIEYRDHFERFAGP